MIEAKNDEIEDYKSKIEFGDSTKFIQNQEINLNDNEDEDTNVCLYPFHNPIFGNFPSSLYNQ